MAWRARTRSWRSRNRRRPSAWSPAVGEPAPRQRLRGVAALALVLAAAASPVAAPAQGAPEPTLKAAFLLNFVRFTTWPPGALGGDAVLTLCVSDRAIAEALGDTVRGQRVVGRDLEFRQIRAADSLAGCAVMYVGRADARALPQMLRHASEHAVLTVSDADDFVTQGGMIQLFPMDGRMRFAINVEAAQRAGLRMSSNLLRLAGTDDR